MPKRLLMAGGDDGSHGDSFKLQRWWVGAFQCRRGNRSVATPTPTRRAELRRDI